MFDQVCRSYSQRVEIVLVACGDLNFSWSPLLQTTRHNNQCRSAAFSPATDIVFAAHISLGMRVFPHIYTIAIRVLHQLHHRSYTVRVRIYDLWLHTFPPHTFHYKGVSRIDCWATSIATYCRYSYVVNAHYLSSKLSH